MKYHAPGEKLPPQVTQRSVADTWQTIRGYTSPISVGVHSYLPDGRPLHAGYATELESGSFKERGGIEKTMLLSRAGVSEAVVFSAGNHLAGCALGSRATQVLIHGFVPGYTPDLKIDRSRELSEGSINVTRVDGGLDEARSRAVELAQRKGIPVIEPYDDGDVSRAQGTMLLELLLRQPDIDHVVVPEGGGGLAAGCMQVVHELGLQTKVYGAKLSRRHELCEGAYVATPGRVALRARRQHPELWGGTLTVDPADVGAMVALEDAVRLEHAEAMGNAAFEGYPEATALLGAAAVHRYANHFDGTVAVLITGSNANMKNLDTLHDEFQKSQASSASTDFRVASGYQLRRQAA